MPLGARVGLAALFVVTVATLQTAGQCWTWLAPSGPCCMPLGAGLDQCRPAGASRFYLAHPGLPSWANSFRASGAGWWVILNVFDWNLIDV